MDGKAISEKPYQWIAKSVAGILERPEDTGCTVNFKTYSKSHNLKKRLNNAPENYRIFPNTQHAIIDEKVFERVQELRENKRCPAKQAERQGLFSGLLYCTMHYIQEETLKLFVLRRIFDVTAMFIDNADDFRRVVQK